MAQHWSPLAASALKSQAVSRLPDPRPEVAMSIARTEVRVFERTALVSDHEMDAFKRDGVIHMRGVLTRRDVELLRRAVDDQFQNRETAANAYDFQDLAEQYWSGKKKLDGGAATRFNLDRMAAAIDGDFSARGLFDGPASTTEGSFFYEAAGWRRYPEIREVALDSDLAEISALLLDSEFVNFWEDTTFVKTPGANLRTPFHQDFTYFQITGKKCCIAWIPLDQTDRENGAMEYVIGSHKWSKEFAPSVFIAQTTIPGSTGEKLPDIEAFRENYDIRTISASPGDVIFHDVMTVHGSSGNISTNRMRRGVSFRYCGDDVRYWAKPGAVPQPWVRDKITDGDALYSIYYPRVWPRPFPGARLSLLYSDGV
jgi:ectoine hydroxylase-related dioxygenase (phytanoyl-CoA dioxygenase family)